jgi:uncharacterized protein DUF4160
MPEISRFFGIVIKMYYNDHPPPHFHAEYAGDQMVVSIETLAIIGGKLAPRAVGLVMEWPPSIRPSCRMSGIKPDKCNRLTGSIHYRSTSRRLHAGSSLREWIQDPAATDGA